METSVEISGASMVTFCEHKKLKKFILGFKVFCSPDLEKILHKVVATVVLTQMLYF